MAGRVEGKVALVTGAGRGQGHSHAVKLAAEGADIIAIDICEQIASVPYPLSSDADLQVTADAVRETGRRVFTAAGDVRDPAALGAAVDEGVEIFGRLDIACANAGIFSVGAALEMPQTAWQDMIDVNLTGVWNTVRASAPHIIGGGRRGSIVVISSQNGLVGAPMFAHYVAAKHGVIGLVRAIAVEFANDLIRVNAVLPGGVDTEMIRHFDGIMTTSVRYVGPGAEQSARNFPVPANMLHPADISDAVLFLASDEAKHMTGSLISVDGHSLIRAASQFAGA